MKKRSGRGAAGWLVEGLHALQSGRVADAEAILRGGLANEPSNADGLHLLAVVEYRARRYDAAIELFRRAIRSNRTVPDYHNNLGLALHVTGSPLEAIKSYRRALELQRDHASALNNLGVALRALRRYDEAEAALRRAIATAPAYAEAHNNLALALADRDRYEEAVASLRKAIAIRPGYIEASCNLGELLMTLRRTGEAAAVYDDALGVQPHDAILHHQRALTLFLEGRLEAAWREYEWRFGPGTGRFRRDFPHPVWEGQPLAGCRVLVWMEQGIGDELLFASLLPDVLDAARECVVECAPKLVPLFRRSFPAAVVVARSDPPEPTLLSGIDYQVAAADLARWLRPTPESFPGRHGYLTADPERMACWRARIAQLGAGLKVGFSWRSKDVSSRRALSCTALEQWGPIFAVGGVQFVSLQYDECGDELAAARNRFGVPLHAFSEVDLFNDLEEAAALTLAMDLVISAPTAVSVLSAGLGVETWQMTYGPDWKTFGTGRDLWHPTLTRYERAPGQPWEPTIRKIAAELALRGASAPG